MVVVVVVDAVVVVMVVVVVVVVVVGLVVGETQSEIPLPLQPSLHAQLKKFQIQLADGLLEHCFV